MINGKSINRVIAESLFNLAQQKRTVVEGDMGQEGRLFNLIEGTSSSTSKYNNVPEAQSILADGTTGVFTMNGSPARADLIDVWVNDVLQHPIEVYEIFDDVIQFNEIPPQGTDIYIKFR